MRYIVQFVLPALIFALLVYVVARKKSARTSDDPPILSNTVFVLCLVIASGLTVGLLFGISAL